MKCKRVRNFAKNQEFDKHCYKKNKWHKKVNWFRAYMLLPWWDRIRVSGERIF